MNIRKWYEKWKIWIVICAIAVIASFSLGFYKGEKIYTWIIAPFHNPNGVFDYGIFWTAIGAIITAVIAFVSVWQTRKANETNNRLLQLEESKETPMFNLIGKDFEISCDDKISTQQLCFKIALISGTAYSAYFNPIQISYSKECFTTFFTDCVCKKESKYVFSSPLKSEPLFIANVWTQLELVVDNPIGGELLQNIKNAKVILYKLDLHYIRNGKKKKRAVNIFYSAIYHETKQTLNLKFEDFYVEKEEEPTK